MRLIDPTVSGPEHKRESAPRLASLEGRRIALLSNGKANADVLLRATAERFVKAHGCEVVDFFDKRNAGTPCASEQLERLAGEADFLITAVGD
ncbi:MAG: hypothetical protein V3U43_04860 [Pseudomonadales bacterium]